MATVSSSDKVFAKAKAILGQQLGVDDDEITRDAIITDDLGADSLDVVEIIMASEEAFNLDIQDGDADKLKTVGDLVLYLERRVRAQREPSTI